MRRMIRSQRLAKLPVLFEHFGIDPKSAGAWQVIRRAVRHRVPPDNKLKADLAARHWELTSRGIKLESKDDIRKRIGRSPSKGDAVVMAWAEGDRAVNRALRANRPIVVENCSG